MSVSAGCGLALPDRGWPAYACLSASPGCWALHGQALGLHCSDRAHWPAHQPLVDTYALRHSGGDDRRSRRSAGRHLAAPARCVWDADEAALAAARRALSRRADRPRLAPLERRGPTIADVPVEGGPDVHLEGVHAYIQAVRGEWSAHHATARRLLAGLHA